MLQLQEILDLINKRGKQKIAPIIMTWRGVYYGMSLHIDGACPAFYDLRYDIRERVYILNTLQTIPNNYFGVAYQEIFDRYLFSRHPREPEITRQWRMSQYKPFTQSPFKRVIQVITGAIFQDSGYSITIDDKADNEYIWGNNFQGKNLVGFLISKFKSICADPNGCFVVIPKEPHYETTTSQVEPAIHFIPSRFIRWHSKDEIVFEIDEIIWAVNSIGYFRFGKVPNSNLYYHIDEEQGGYYAHMMYRMPVIVAGGEWNEHGFYESHLQSAKPIADEFVGTMSALQMVNKEASHPFIIEADTKCGDCGGMGSYQADCSCGSSCSKCHGEPLLASCNTCHGSGRMSRNPADRMIAPAGELSNQLIQVVNPEVAVNEMHIKYVDKLYDDMLEALNLHYIDQAQSGVAKDKDMETRYQFISNINNDLFDRLIPELLDAILYLRNVRVDNGQITPYKPEYSLVKPSQFQLKTSYDLVEEYKLAGESKMPPYMLEAISIDYVDKQFGGNEALKRKTIIINQMDILAVMNTADISIMLLNGGATTRDLQFHLYLPKIIDKIRREKGDDWFIGAPFDTLQSMVDVEFKKIKPGASDIDDSIERVEV